MHGFPRGIAHRATRQLFNYSGPDPVIGRIIDNLDSQKMYTICSWVGNCSPLFSKGTYNGGVTCGDVGAILTRGDVASDTLVATVNASVCTAVTLQNLGKREMDSNGNLSAFVAPTYMALRTCTTHGGSFSTINDAKNFTNSSAERLFILTVVVNTQANGGSFDNDTKLQDYVQVYLNGKRINTTARKTVPGSSWTTITTSITPGGNYPLHSYNSAALTYGITQVNEYTSNPRTYRTKHPMIASTNTSGGANGIGRSIQNNGQAQSVNSAGGYGLRVQYFNGVRMILMETNNECRSTTAYTSSEIATHIGNLSVKWGLPMAYRWIILTNNGSASLSFARLGFYCSHSEAYTDSTGQTTDAKTGAYMNIMKGFTQTIGLTTVGTVSVGVGGTTPASIKAPANTTISSVLSMSNATASVADAAPTALGQAIDIPAGSSITIDLADSVTCSHLRFGKFFTANTSDYANLKMQVQLVSTVPDTERPGIIYDYDLIASANASGVTHGQFPLYSGPINARTTQFVTSTAHINTCGVYALLQRSGSSPVSIPAYQIPNTLNNMRGMGSLYVASLTRGCTVTVSGGSWIPAMSVADDFKLHLFATSAPFTDPGSRNCTVTGYSLADGTITFNVTPPTSGNCTLVVFAYDSSGTLRNTIVGSTVAVIDLSQYILYNQTKNTTPGWDKQHAGFARPTATSFSSMYTSFVRLTFDNTLYMDTSGTEWNSTTGSVGNMMLKNSSYSPNVTEEFWTISNSPIASCYAAPISILNSSGLSGSIFAGSNDGQFTADNGTSYYQVWDNSANSSPWIRWGYKYNVTARSVGLCAVAEGS